MRFQVSAQFAKQLLNRIQFGMTRHVSIHHLIK